MTKFAVHAVSAVTALSLAGLCWSLPVNAQEGADAAAPEVVSEQAATQEPIELQAPALPRKARAKVKVEGDYVLQPDTIESHTASVFICNDLDSFLQRDPRMLRTCCGVEGEDIDMTQPLNKRYTDAASLETVAKATFHRIVDFQGSKKKNTYRSPLLSVMGGNDNTWFKYFKAYSGGMFDDYRREYMKPYRDGHLRFTERYKSYVYERRGNSLRSWPKTQSLADLSMVAVSTPIAIIMEQDDKRTRNRNAWMPTPKEDFMYASSKHLFPWVGFLEYSLKITEAAQPTSDGEASAAPEVTDYNVVCSWDKLTLFALDDIIEADRN